MDPVPVRCAHAFLSRPGDPPYLSSVAVTNAAIVRALPRLGWSVQRAAAAPGRSDVPLHSAQLLAEFAADPPADLALYDDAGLSYRPPSRRWSRRNAVVYHGLFYNARVWLGSDHIDVHCANSPYLADVLRSLFTFPDWRRRRCLDVGGLTKITSITLPLPCVAEPRGSPDLAGEDVPSCILELHDQGVVLGHALQTEKIDFFATASIGAALNRRARDGGSPPVRLVVPERDLHPSVRATIDTALARAGWAFDDVFVSVPHLNQRALFTVMRRCRFGLSYNTCHESFGFYPLESVHNGCPVYTNGIGNNRHLLPPEHGITVLEDTRMALEPHSSAPYEIVADAIFTDLREPLRVAERCARGREVIDRTWTEAAFDASLQAALARLDAPPADAVEFGALVVAMSPLVRDIDFDSGAILCDAGNRVLDASALAALTVMLGRACSDVAAESSTMLDELQRLFRYGVLALRPSIDTSNSGGPDRVHDNLDPTGG